MEEITPATLDWFDTGAWVGRQQAFAVIANKCSAARALSLQQMKETRCYKKLGLSWDDFCQQHTGIGHRHADRIIGQYEDFGEAYFRLSGMARISPEGYREIADNVVGNCLEYVFREFSLRVVAAGEEVGLALRVEVLTFNFSDELRELAGVDERSDVREV